MPHCFNGLWKCLLPSAPQDIMSYDMCSSYQRTLRRAYKKMTIWLNLNSPESFGMMWGRTPHQIWLLRTSGVHHHRFTRTVFSQLDTGFTLFFKCFFQIGDLRFKHIDFSRLRLNLSVKVSRGNGM